MPESRINFLTKISVLFWVYFVVTVVVSLQKYFLGAEDYGNYLIFKNSFLHLLSGKDLYALYPELKIDLFKYSPTFSVLFSPFSFLPDIAGVIIWNLINAMLLFFAIRLMSMEERKKAYLLWFILIELITSLQNFQSNALTASLMIFVFLMLERKNYLLAGICVAIGFYIKVFGILAALLWVLYPGKGKFFFYSLASMIILFSMPLIFISSSGLEGVYQSWFHLLSTDTVHELNHSMMSIMKNWFGLEVNRTGVQATGLVLLSLPLMRWKYFLEKRFKLYFLCSILIASVIFNHKAESATYIIAVAGCAIWFFNSERTPLEISLMVTLFLLTCLSPTDMFPKFVRENYIVPYSLKALPCILIWVKIQYDLLSFRRTGAVS